MTKMTVLVRSARLTAVRTCCRAFEITAIVIYRDGRLGVTRDPQGCEAAWWCQADRAGRSQRRPHWCGFPAAAARPGLPVTAHDAVLARNGGRRQDRDAILQVA